MSISSLLEDEDEDVRALTFLLLKDVSRRHRQLVLHLLRRLLVRPLESASCRPPRPLLEMDRSSWKQHVEVPPALFLGPPEKVEEQVSRAVQGREVDELLAGLLADAMEEEEIAELCRIAQEGVELSSRRERIDRLLVMLTSSAWTLRYAACCLLPWVTERGNPKVVVSLIAAMQDEEVAVKVEAVRSAAKIARKFDEETIKAIEAARGGSRELGREQRKEAEEIGEVGEEHEEVSKAAEEALRKLSQVIVD
uniref:HEAT repeat domain-containing protein n=1 Tax=Hanusia phi TaxID=3032 RepID=A0A7S0F2M1_9CRYP